MTRSTGVLGVAALLLAACTGPARVAPEEPTTPAPVTTTTPATTTTAPAPTTTTTTVPPTTPTTLPPGVTEPPEWLGTRVLPLRPDGFGVAQPTPEELVDRRFVTVDLLPPPNGDDFQATIGPVPPEVAARSTWTPECPVGLNDLRYLTISFWGFDQRPHTGEMIVNARAAGDVVEVFRALYEARFPIEEMRVVSPEDLERPPTGDGNNTTGFTCRRAVLSSGWSQHAYGLAIDVNPFHNPYQRGDLVIPELASAYLERDDRPGVILPGDVVVTGFAAIGWSWGGDWRTLVDYMHFSESGR